jgi:4'-phosphopantetheinyl transferase
VTTQVLVASAPDRPEALGRTLDVLSDEERDRASRYRRPVDAASFAAGRALLRLALAERLGAAPRALVFDTWCARCASPHGKPRLVDPPADLDFSLSRAGPILLLALSSEPVGVDVERRDRSGDLDVTRIAFADDEQAELEALPPAARAHAFLTAWTRKEALLKALGHGLSVDPKSVSVTYLDGVEPRVRRLPDEFGPPEAWSLVPLEGDDWIGAAAIRGSPTTRVESAQHLLA